MPEGSFLNPARIVEALGVEPGMVVAEFGCGTGIFALRVAEAVGRDGKVFALDVQKEALESVQSKARMEGVFNIETVWADLERPGAAKVGENSCDVVLVPNMLFQSQQKANIFTEARRVAKPGGRVCVVDWYPEKALFGVAQGWPVTPQVMRAEAERAGLTFETPLETSSPYHYGLVFRK